MDTLEDDEGDVSQDAELVDTSYERSCCEECNFGTHHSLQILLFVSRIFQAEMIVLVLGFLGFSVALI